MTFCSDIHQCGISQLAALYQKVVNPPKGCNRYSPLSLLYTLGRTQSSIKVKFLNLFVRAMTIRNCLIDIPILVKSSFIEGIPH